MVMQLSSKNWKGLIGILGLCACAGLLIDSQDFLLTEPQDFSHHSVSPVFDWIKAKPKSVTDLKQSLTTRPKEPDLVDDGPPKIIQDKVRIHNQFCFPQTRTLHLL